MREFMERMRQVAAEAVNQKAHPAWGIVENVDPSGPLVRLRLQPDNVLTGWMQVAQPSASGSGTAVSIPSPGDMALTVPDFGEGEHRVVVGFAHSAEAPLQEVAAAPGTGGTPSTEKVPAKPGEWIINAFGSVIRVAASGAIYLRPGGGTVFVDGNLAVNGSITAEKDMVAKGAVTAGAGGPGAVGLLTHKHQYANQGAPSVPIPGS